MLLRITIVTAIFLACRAPAHAQSRPMIYAETIIQASPDEAFSDWTTSAGIEAFFAPEATIVAEPGGLYELCFDPSARPTGQCGNDQGRILALQTGQMISFTWAMPPYMPEIRPHLTVVQILFEPIEDDQTRVRLFHTGFGSSEAWDEGRAYFDKAWPQVLENYRASKLTDQP